MSSNCLYTCIQSGNHWYITHFQCTVKIDALEMQERLYDQLNCAQYVLKGSLHFALEIYVVLNVRPVYNSRIN